jgi:hypothetical protein
MESEEKSKYSFLIILVLTLFSISTLMMFFFIFEFSDNYKIIKHKNEFKKIKVKIDSSVVSYSRSGRNSSSSSSTSYYFNKGSYFNVQDTKGILFNYNSPIYEIEDYRTKHSDSLNVWYFNTKIVKFASENQVKIDVSEEVENNKRVTIYFLIYVVFVLIVIKFRNGIFKQHHTTS